MHTGCHHNQCTDYKSFAKRNISHQIKSLTNSLIIGYLPIFSPIVALGFRKGVKNFVWGAPPPCPPLVSGLITVFPNHVRAISTILPISMLFFRCVEAKGVTSFYFWLDSTPPKTYSLFCSLLWLPSFLDNNVKRTLNWKNRRRDVSSWICCLGTSSA